MLHIEQAIVVEGKYDKIKLKSILDAVVIPTHGYDVFSNKETVALIRFYAEKSGIIILTDSDSAGFRIRNHIKGLVPPERITNVYIPEIFGKEPRKSAHSAEGTLGVEGVSKSVILEAFRRAGVTAGETLPKNEITRADFYELGLSGGKGSVALRSRLTEQLELPRLMTTTSLLEAVNVMMTREAFINIVNDVKSESD